MLNKNQLENCPYISKYVKKQNNSFKVQESEE